MKKIKNRAVQQSKSVSIVGGGVLYDSLLSSIANADVIIGVDRGALWLLEHGITPHIALGDFDSVRPQEFKKIQKSSLRVLQYPPEKDATDLELALEEALTLNPHAVYLYGVLGRRFDHSMGGIAMLRRLVSHNIYGEIVDNFSKINIVRRGRRKFSRDQEYPYVSILPLDQSTSITLKGFRYDVTHYEFLLHSTRGISNEIPGSAAMLTIHRGMALIVRSRD